MKKIIVIVLCVIVSSTMIYFVFNSISEGVQNKLEAVEFSKEIWNQYPEKRYTMVDDLLENHDFSNMTKNDVINLLGSKSLDAEGNALRYETSGGLFKDEVLQFIFDEQGYFVKIGIAN